VVLVLLEPLDGLILDPLFGLLRDAALGTQEVTVVQLLLLVQLALQGFVHHLHVQSFAQVGVK